MHRTVSKQDRRARVLELTDESCSVLARIIPVVEDAQVQILTGLTGDERAWSSKSPSGD